MGRRDRRGVGITLVLALALGCMATRPAAAAGCDAPEAQAHLAAAEEHLAAGRYRDAISEFNRAILVAPDCDRAKQGVIEANRAMLERRGAPDSPEAGISRHLRLGSAAFDAGDYARAIAEWEAALALDPDNRIAQSLIASAREAQVDALIEEGSRAFAQGDTAAAMSAWERARQLAPHNRVVLDLLHEGQAQADREEEVALEEDLARTMRKIRTELEQSRMLPHEEMTGGGIRLRDRSERPPFEIAGEERQRQIMEELRNPVSLDFEETDLRAVLRFLSEVTGINILVDEDVFEALGEIDPDDEEAKPQIKVTIFVNELPLESALKGMLRQHGLDFQIQRDFLYISTPEVLRASSFEQLEIRYYRLRDTARIALPKLGAQPGQITQAGGDVEIQDIAAGGDLIQRLQEVDADEVQDAPVEAINFGVARLMAILRNFVPVVVETRTGAALQQGQAARTADTTVGGWSRITSTQNANDAENVVRERQWDAAGREILSRLDYDAATHTLVVRNTPSNLDLTEELLGRLDKPSRQVAIEARFMSVDMQDIHRVNTDLSVLGLFRISETGISASLGGAGATLGSTTFGVPLGGLFVDELFGSPIDGKEFRLTYSGQDGELVQASIDLLTQLDNTELVSAPRITTLSGKPAIIQDVRTQTFATDADIQTTIVQPPPGSDADPVVIPEVDFTFTAVVTGVTLTVTPLVLDDNTVRLVLLPDVSQLGEGDSFEVPFAIFDQAGNVTIDAITITLIEVFRQSLFTNVLVEDGETLVLGGLVTLTAQFQEKSVPFLRNVPIVGNFFRSTGESVRRTQLLIFIKCNVISPAGVAYVRLK